MERRSSFPPQMREEGPDCPECGAGPVEILAARFVWMHKTCGAYGYYHDGVRVFPDAVYRVKGKPGLRQHSKEFTTGQKEDADA